MTTESPPGLFMITFWSVSTSNAINTWWLYLMLDRNEGSYIKFIKFLHLLRICICCRGLIRNAIEYNSDEAQMKKAMDHEQIENTATHSVTTQVPAPNDTNHVQENHQNGNNNNDNNGNVILSDINSNSTVMSIKSVSSINSNSTAANKSNDGRISESLTVNMQRREKMPTPLGLHNNCSTTSMSYL